MHTACPYKLCFMNVHSINMISQYIKLRLLFHVSHHVLLKALGKPHLAILNKTYGIRELLYQSIIKVSKNHQQGDRFISLGKVKRSEENNTLPQKVRSNKVKFFNSTISFGYSKNRWYCKKSLAIYLS